MPHLRLPALALAIAAFFSLHAGAAGAATVDATAGVLRVAAAPGEANTLTVSLSGGILTVTDTTAAAKLTAGNGCTLPQAGRVTCSATGVASLDLAGGDGDDSLTVTANLPAHLAGGDGADTLAGGPGADVLDGGPGADVLTGSGGKDTADYSPRTAPVSVDLDSTSAIQGEAGEGDRFTDHIENAAGGAGADHLVGDSYNNILAGGSGDDVLDGRSGADRLEGDDGRDTADYSSRRYGVSVDADGNADDGQWGEYDDVRPDVERILGGSGDDRLTGTAADDELIGNGGRDTLDGGQGQDRLEGDDGDDTLRGSDGDDVLDAGNGNDSLDGGYGNDALSAGAGNDRAWGGDGADSLDGADGDDELHGGAGDDNLTGAAGWDRLYADDGSDAVDGGAGNDQLWGGNGQDDLAGGEDDDRIWAEGDADAADGGAGNDTVDGGSGNDGVSGGEGDDRVTGGWGDDQLDGGAGEDSLDGNDGADLVYGGADDDQVRGSSGADRLLGGDGDDQLWGGSGDDVLDGGGGADAMAGDDGQDTVDYGSRVAAVAVTIGTGDGDDGEAGEGDDVGGSVDDVIGGAGNDNLTGSGWYNAIDGGAGDDRIDGQGGDDHLSGADGNDLVIGGPGTDQLDGGNGDDHLSATDETAEDLLCGAGQDVAVLDKADRPQECEKRNLPKTSAPAPLNSVPARTSRPSSLKGVRIVRGGGGFVRIPGTALKIDRRILGDLKWMQAKYHVSVTAGFAMEGHAPHGEHPIGLAVDLVPGPGGSWSTVDRLARWAEPRQNHPRAPFRWVGYNGDPGHGRGDHLHLSWRHAPARRGHPAAWVERLSFGGGGSAIRPVAGGTFARLARLSNPRLGGVPSITTGLKARPRCQGSAQLVSTWRAAARAFGLRWSVLAGITEIESGHGCNMGPSKAGAIGWTQFMPATWKHWGMDADGDRKASPYNSVDAIYSTARYLRASGAPRSYRRALFAYNHATWYVNSVLRRAKKYR